MIATVGPCLPYDLLEASGRYAGPLPWDLGQPTPRADAWLETKFPGWARSMLDGLGLMLLATPILMPVVIGVGMSEIWFGIFLIRAMEIGFVHPPLGMNLYVIQGVVKDISIQRIFKGVLPFLASDFVHLFLLLLFPALVLWLPAQLGH